MHGLAGCLKDNVKLKCKVIVENLRPATLKEQVRRALECGPSLKSDLHRLFDLVNQEAIRNQQAYDMYQHMGKRDNGGRDSKNNKKQLDSARVQVRKDDRRPSVKPLHKKRDGLPPGGCLYCKRNDHWLEDCPSATEANKKDAMKMFLENKRRGKEASTVKRLVTNDSLGESEVIFNDLVGMPYCLDNGTTYNVIPRSIVDELQLLDPSVTLKALEPPVRGRAVGGAYITCTQSVDLDIGLQTVAGRVNIRGLTCVITETNEDEFLLGKRTLRSLGSDVDELLAGLVTQGSSDVDPFDDERNYKAIARPDTDAIKARLHEMIAEAVDNGFPAD
ncbi:hypothetical protein PHYSODRAFT_530693 [Phytophthora sojae]|uniref:CCHC-type domain-containing protein n=1 Tax=Phytophthora sojae (strain P6497) TaxID=1094619 RepID=G5ABP4_PHYSP|nr:hypothetical protein PHYSODRAFT_530693 [Phytophthora sojae]EGZ06769.1 hypothetical protein PHYSODRAFT_530693 [Phytophthora sojae]|eukprot:XP_009537533.1 hypothetical protein PHYSODRAFT_530693 [Phytophthora sojae]